MLLRCYDHGPDVIGKGLRNPTLTYDGEKFCSAVPPRDYIRCPESNCTNDALAWLTVNETEQWEDSREVFQTDNGNDVVLMHFDVALAEYVGHDSGDDFELC